MAKRKMGTYGVAIWHGEEGRNLRVHGSLCPCGCDGRCKLPNGTVGYLSVSGPDGIGVTIYLNKQQVAAFKTLEHGARAARQKARGTA